MRRYIVILAALCLGAVASAQKERTLTLNKETNLIDVVYYHANGEVSQTGSYTADGKLEGKWISYNENGTKKVVAYYKDGKKVGKWTYFVDGKQKEVNYSNNIASL